MSTVRKMQLVSEAEINRLRAKQIREYDPDLSAIVRLETEIDKILNDNTKSETEKIAELRSAQLKARSLREQEATNGKIPAAAPAAAVPVAVQQMAAAAAAEQVQAPGVIDATDEEIILKGLRGVARQKAEQVLAEIKKHPESIKFNKQNNTLVINNEVIDGSNFIDIFDYTFASSVKNKKRPAGIELFYNTLRQLHIPQSYIPRRNAYSTLPKPPPGTGANILRIYPM